MSISDDNDNDSGLSCSQSLNMNNLSLDPNLRDSVDKLSSRERLDTMSFDSAEFDSLPCSPDDVNSSSIGFSYSKEPRFQIQSGNQLKSNVENNIERISVYDSLYSKRRGILPRSKMNSENKTRNSQIDENSFDKRSFDYSSVNPKNSTEEHVYMNLPVGKNPYPDPGRNWYDNDSPSLAASTPYGSDDSPPVDRSPTSGRSGNAIPPQPKAPAPMLSKQMSSGIQSISRNNSIGSRQLSCDSGDIQQPDASESTRKYSSRKIWNHSLDDDAIETPPPRVPPLNLSLLEVLHKADSDSDNVSPSGSMNNYFVMEDTKSPSDKNVVKSPPKRMWSFENGEESKYKHWSHIFAMVN